MFWAEPSDSQLLPKGELEGGPALLEYHETASLVGEVTALPTPLLTLAPSILQPNKGWKHGEKGM